MPVAELAGRAAAGFLLDSGELLTVLRLQHLAPLGNRHVHASPLAVHEPELDRRASIERVERLIRSL